MNNEPETDAEKHSFDWLLGRTTMSDTPRTDKAQKEYEDENYDAAVYPEFARQLERELAAKDAGIASMRAQLRDADKEMLRFHRLEDELTVKYAELADAKTVIANMTEALEAAFESDLPAKSFFTLAAALALNKEASK